MKQEFFLSAEPLQSLEKKESKNAQKSKENRQNERNRKEYEKKQGLEGQGNFGKKAMAWRTQCHGPLDANWDSSSPLPKY